MAEWWTAPAESEDGRLIMISAREDIENFRNNPRFSIRIEITWKYNVSPDAAMPSDEDAKIMGEATDKINEVLDADPVAVMTAIFTGAGERTWVFYTLSTNIFQKKLNQALAEPLPLLPLSIIAENDPNWEEYDEVKSFQVR